MSYLLRSSLLTGFGSLVQDLRGDPEGLLQRFNIRPDIEHCGETFIPFRQACALLEYCADTLSCPDFGMQLSTRQGLAMLGPIAVLARNANTVESALTSISNYLHVLTPALRVRQEIALSARFIRVHIELREPGLVSSRQMLELFMGNGQSITQLLVGAKEYGLAMHFPHQRLGPQSLYNQFWGCETLFGADFCAVDLPIHVMQHRISGADEETARVAAEYLATQHGGAPADLRGEVCHLIRTLLPTGHGNIRLVAEQLNLHPRTLQRHLAAEGHVFEQLLDAERKALAISYLAEPRLRLTQIAGMLGYADQSALNRSCQRWFSKTPKQLRREKAAGGI
jgi:AraC-like DNA-binding protein